MSPTKPRPCASGGHGKQNPHPWHDHVGFLADVHERCTLIGTLEKRGAEFWMSPIFHPEVELEKTGNIVKFLRRVISTNKKKKNRARLQAQIISCNSFSWRSVSNVPTGLLWVEKWCCDSQMTPRDRSVVRTTRGQAVSHGECSSDNSLVFHLSTGPSNGPWPLLFGGVDVACDKKDNLEYFLWF